MVVVVSTVLVKVLIVLLVNRLSEVSVLVYHSFNPVLKGRMFFRIKCDYITHFIVLAKVTEVRINTQLKSI
jgi:hypothetical protein